MLNHYLAYFGWVESTIGVVHPRVECLTNELRKFQMYYYPLHANSLEIIKRSCIRNCRPKLRS